MKRSLFKIFLRGFYFALILVAPVLRAAEGPAISLPATEFHYAIGLSPYLDREIKDTLFRRLITFVVEEASTDSAIDFYDAYQLKSVCSIQIPRAKAFASAKTRAIQFKDQIHLLRNFLAATNIPPTMPQIDASDFKGAIRFPQFMELLAANRSATTNTLKVFLFGSPLHIEAREPAFSMVRGYFPSDGHILSTREQSVYGTQSRGERLRSFQIYWAYPGDPWVSDLHQEKIHRFWANYVAQQGALLLAFSGDMETVWKTMRGPNPRQTVPSAWVIDRSNTKLEMIRATREITVADWIAREQIPNAAQTAPTKSEGPLKIGIRWQGRIDLDLYASATAESETLFFEHTRAPEGYYFKDHRSSPDREYEFIEFEKPVDIFKVRAMVNYYKGRMNGGPHGEARVEFEGKIYSAPFELESATGNEGRSGPGQESCWTELDLPRILKLARVAQQ